MSLTVAIVGRPNVGKSTLFNRLIRKRLAIVDDTPGVTRDRRYGEAHLGDLTFTVIDTAGLEEGIDDSLEGRMRQQTHAAIAAADVTLMVFDARAGITPMDEHFARIVRKAKRPVILIANKAEGRAGLDAAREGFSLGLGTPLPLSAEHGEGLGDLYDALEPFALKKAGEASAAQLDADLEEVTSLDLDEDAGEEDVVEAPPAPKHLQLAIVGRPNVGKSTMVNALLGEDRLLTGPEAGITRDSIAIDWSWQGQAIRLIDTAGLRRHSRVTEKLERLSGADTRRAIQYAHVVVLVLDANDMLEKQDLTIARQIVEEGRALIIVANKWDAVEDKNAAIKKLNDRIDWSLPQIKGVPILTVSAMTERGLDKMMKAVLDIYETWNRRVSTAKLNRWLSEVTAMHPPPLVAGRRIKIRYITQIKTRPPTFALFASKADDLPDSYHRYLVKSLRDVFDLPGTPIRIVMRRTDNPYDSERD
ncbi:ribosome biogenesis GTPase Der [Dongia rigui]|uniref:GTPase Der n=1 Tax=Dongia rigui TaxID=940149 RepID=A0ABU5DWD9_9PROT|nr:ribosome biogenesis GTPase Der [Dongia rigui]MDY0871620.1 ribosome biogenesis GTPase Der [Dongia rigui]